jgi:hypothetical protein
MWLPLLFFQLLRGKFVILTQIEGSVHVLVMVHVKAEHCSIKLNLIWGCTILSGGQICNHVPFLLHAQYLLLLLLKYMVRVQVN